jgi:NAD-dependent SIR2 family protein deacetylase
MPAPLATPAAPPRAAAAMPPAIPRASIESFQAHLLSSHRVLALLGAGLSAASGLPTFRGAGGMWRTHDATDLATPEAFAADPGLVWQFYSYRRHMALKAKPNGAHFALAELARKMPGFVTLSQNVDGRISRDKAYVLTISPGLSPRAGHPAESLKLLHGSLFDVKCSSFFCKHFETNNFTDPIVPALALPTNESDPTTNGARAARQAAAAPEPDVADTRVSLPELALRDLPHCPTCGTGLLRPGVVWFGEALPTSVLEDVDSFIGRGRVDLIMVIGTSAAVWPAAGYIEVARAQGARVAVVNMDGDLPPGGLRRGDWFFQGDASVIVPELLKPVTGDVGDMQEKL